MGSKSSVLYGLGKIHKKTKKGLPPFRSTLSVIETPTYKLAKFLISFLTTSAVNEYSATDSFHFMEENCQQDPNGRMADLDVDSLLTVIPLDEAIDISNDILYNGNDNPPRIPKNNFQNLLNIANREYFFHVNNKYYKQVDGVVMGFPWFQH